MIKNSSKMMFMLILILGTLISISANSWLSAWMGLEINLLAFIPLMTASNNLISTEASLKYFLTQALASATLMFSIMFYMMKNNLLFQLNMLNYMLNLMIMSSLLLKMGAAPFHFWFPNVMEGLNWNNSLILMTWQKIAPMMLLSYLNYNLMINISIILSMIVGSMGGLNQTSLRKIMAFSSISHLGWMICALISNESLWFMYFLIYSILSFNMILFFKMFNLSQMNQVFSSFFKSKKMKFILMTNMLSLGGLPPFLGFLPKLMVIQSLVLNNQLMIMFVMTVLTLITLFFYLRLCYSSFMLNYNELYWNMNSSYKNINIVIYMTTSCLSIFSLFSISLMYYIL